MLTEKIKETIELLKNEQINGCITGSSMIPDANFDEWDSVPDIDVFVYNEMQLLYASDLLMFKHGFKLLSAGEDWKFDRVKNRGAQGNAALTTLKLTKDDVVVNITYKRYKDSLVAVLQSFDMSTIMIGYDMAFGYGLDMRTKNIRVFDDKYDRWSDDPKVAKPNPMRKQDVDMYGVEMWVRQFDRVIKYWNRGIDTRPMARFYIELITGVIERGQLFASEKGTLAFKEFVETYEPVKQKMVEWLESKEDC